MAKVKADLHNHLEGNGSFSSFNDVIDHAERKLGKGGIFSVVNISKDDYRYEKFAESPGYERENLGNSIYVPEKEILIIKGHEVIKKKGHLLILGLPEYKNIQSNSYADIFKETREEYNGIVIADHPFYREGIMNYLEENPIRIDEILSQLDGWEVFNATGELWFPGILPKASNEKSRNFYMTEIKPYYDVGAISSTDGHQVKVIGRSYTLLDSPEKTSSEVFNNSLRQSIRSNKDLINLVTVPNKWEASIHASLMIKETLLGKRKAIHKSFEDK